jgi:two-component system cell cycle response regulator
MKERRPRVLLASHATHPLPRIEAPLAEDGIETVASRNLVETAGRITAEAPDLVVLQPLSGDGDGFEVQHVLSLRTDERRFALLLVLDDARGAAGLVDRPRLALDDFLIGAPGGAELLLRIRTALRRREQHFQLEREARSLAEETITDFKTGLYNDRYFFQRLRQEVERSRRHRLAVALALIDLDDFKAINDGFDHTFGDYVLGGFARKLRATIRQIDIAARLGGDEFALLLPNTDLEEAALLATRLRTTLSETRFEKNGRGTSLHLSIGIDATQGDEALEPEDFLRRADLALLEAKRRGKNRICLYPEVAGPSAQAKAAGR